MSQSSDFINRIGIDQHAIKTMCTTYLFDHWRDVPFPKTMETLVKVIERIEQRSRDPDVMISPDGAIGMIESWTSGIQKSLSTGTPLSIEISPLFIVLNHSSDHARVEQSTIRLFEKLREYCQLIDRAQLLSRASIFEYSQYRFVSLATTPIPDDASKRATRESALLEMRSSMLHLHKLKSLASTCIPIPTFEYYLPGTLQLSEKRYGRARYAEALNVAHISCLLHGVGGSIKELAEVV